jgi:protein phosphatase 1 regulatory subunit 7
MNNSRLHRPDVCTSWLTQRSFRAAYCEWLLNVTPRNKTKALAAFRKQGAFGPYDGLRVFGIADLSFLRDFPDLLYLEVIGRGSVNTRFLDGLRNLRGLRLESPGAGVDFACFPELEVFVGDWHVDNRNLERCCELRQLRAWHFHARSHDLSDLANIVRLEWLALVQTNITSLSGLETLEDLRYFEVAYAPRLASLEALAAGRIGIRELDLQKAKKIGSYRPIASINHLRRLRITGCAPMPNLKWSAGLNQLDFFSFVDTNVEDGDLSPLLKLPKLQYVGTLDKKHYNYRCDALNDILSQREE